MERAVSAARSPETESGEEPMKATLSVLAASLAVVVLLVVAPAARADDDLPTFRKRGDKEKEFVTQVGTAIVKAARTGPISIELNEYKFEDLKDKKDRKNLEITMNWKGGITRKKYLSTIVVKIDTSNKERWEVLNIDYKDNSISPTSPRTGEIQKLIKQLNRD